MSMPVFPDQPPMKLEDAIAMILSSIAMEELGLSHIIEAESEKLQYVIEKLPECTPQHVAVHDLLAVNQSVKRLLDTVTQNQMLLKGKMEEALDALMHLCPRPPVPPCPPGPPCPPVPPCPPGPPAPPDKKSACCALAVNGCPNQLWKACTPLRWMHTDCSPCCALCLKSDGKKIVMQHGRCYVVSFTLNLKSAHHKPCARVAVQTETLGRKTDLFVCHATPCYADDMAVATASGICVPTDRWDESALSLTLLSPEAVIVEQASICVMAI